MAYSFFKFEKRPDRETLYIAYMMIGSIFKKTIVTNQAAEQQLYLYYKEMNPTAQERKEKSVLKTAEQALASHMAELGNMHAEVYFFLSDNDSHLIFNTGFNIIHVVVTRKGEFTVSFKG